MKRFIRAGDGPGRGGEEKRPKENVGAGSRRFSQCQERYCVGPSECRPQPPDPWVHPTQSLTRRPGRRPRGWDRISGTPSTRPRCCSSPRSSARGLGASRGGSAGGTSTLTSHSVGAWPRPKASKGSRRTRDGSPESPPLGSPHPT